VYKNKMWIISYIVYIVNNNKTMNKWLDHRSCELWMELFRLTYIVSLFMSRVYII
jgi:hypothetical protein